jgi:site-specific recombinase XerD
VISHDFKAAPEGHERLEGAGTPTRPTLSPDASENVPSHKLAPLALVVGASTRDYQRADLAHAPAPLPPERDPRLVYLASLGSEKGRRTMRQAFRVAAAALAPSVALEAFPWWTLRYQHVQALRSALAQRFAPATANKILAAVKGVLKESRRLGLMSADDCTGACDVKPVRGSRRPAGRALSLEEREVLFGACDGAKVAGRRDAALLALLYGCGLRREEAADLDLEDYEPEDVALRIIGKGNKERTVYVPLDAAGYLKAWLDDRGAEAGPIFQPVDRLGRIERRGMTDQAIYEIVKRAAARAGIRAPSPHDFRRTHISELLDAGADLATVQALAGHASPATTARYDRRGERAKRHAANLLAIPKDPR